MFKPRSLNHPVVRRVLRELPKLEDAQWLEPALNGFFDNISCESWDPSAIRDVITAIVTRCPDDDLDLVSGWLAKYSAYADEDLVRRAKVQQLSKLLGVSFDDAYELFEQHEQKQRSAKEAKPALSVVNGGAA